MNPKQKRIQSVLRELYNIHQQLFGQKYSIGLTLDQKSEFNKIIDEFRQLIFTIRSSQDERDQKQNSKNYKNTAEKVKINHEIRQDIQRAQVMLKEAAKRLKNGDVQQKVMQNRQKNLKNCFDLLQDVKQVQQGGIYKPPQYPTLQQIKLKLLDRKDRDEGDEQQINMQQQQAFDKFDQKDKKMDEMLGQIIDVNRNVRNKMKNANEAIDVTRDKIRKNTKKTDNLIKRVDKADKDLAEILKNYQRPSQLCLNITLILMVLALIAVIINLIKSPTF